MTHDYRHTLTPWVLEDRRERGEGFSIKSPSVHYSSCLVAHYIGESDAKFIVRACNTYDALVRIYEAAKKVMDLLEKHGSDAVPHLMDTDENCGQKLREFIAEYTKIIEPKAGE